MVKTVFPLAIHLGGHSRCGRIVKILRNTPLQYLCGRGPRWDRQGKNFTKAFYLTLTVVFLTSELYLLSQVKRLGISEKVVLSP